MRAHFPEQRLVIEPTSSGTSPLASYHKVHPPPPGSVGLHWENFGLFDKWLLMGDGHLQEVIVHGGWTV